MKLPAAETAGYHQVKFIIKKKPQTPFYKKGFKESPQQRLWGIKNS
jgi:hypothetical protein